LMFELSQGPYKATIEKFPTSVRRGLDILNGGRRPKVERENNVQTSVERESRATKGKETQTGAKKAPEGDRAKVLIGE